MFISENTLLSQRLSGMTIKSDIFRLRRDSMFQGEVTKAQINLLIAIVFIICHSFKWINNFFEIKLVKKQIYQRYHYLILSFWRNIIQTNLRVNITSIFQFSDTFRNFGYLQNWFWHNKGWHPRNYRFCYPRKANTYNNGKC